MVRRQINIGRNLSALQSYINLPHPLSGQIKLERDLSEWRISAYEGEINPSGVPVKKKGKAYVTGWYGRFSASRLQNEILPRLANKVKQGNSYPFLITEHRLNEETTATLTATKSSKAKLGHAEWERRNKASEPKWCAIVLSDTEYKLL